MGKQKITNDVLAEKIDSMRKVNTKEFGNIETHLTKLNGQVAENTAWRNMSKGGVKVLAWLIGGGGLITGLFFVLKYIGGI